MSRRGVNDRSTEWWLHGGFRPEQQVKTRLVEPMDRPGTGRPRSGHPDSGFHHQLYRRFQIDDDPLTVRHPTCTLAAACRVGSERRRCDGHGVITHFGAQRPLGQSAKKKGGPKQIPPGACFCSRAYRREPLPSTLAPTRTRRLAFPMSSGSAASGWIKAILLYTVLACLKENRTKLHQACLDALIRHGQ